MGFLILREFDKFGRKICSSAWMRLVWFVFKLGNLEIPKNNVSSANKSIKT